MASRWIRSWAPWLGASLAAAGIVAAHSCTTAAAREPADANHGTNHVAQAGPGHTAQLFSRQCAPCHGERGEANTRTAELLWPRPRPFRDGLFKLVSTDNSVPSDDDLVRTIRHGMTGSAMPGYEWLADEDIRGLAKHVRKLAIDGIEQTLTQAIEATGQKPDPKKIRDQAALRMKPGNPIHVPPAIPATKESLAQGKHLYSMHCAACHGDDGKGRPAPEGFTYGIEQVYARDFTAGVLRGGGSHDQICYRIRGGMPGGHMPPVPLSDAETQILVSYVRTLIPEDAIGRHDQWRHHIRVAHVVKLPEGPDDAAWNNVTAVRLPVAPLQWRRDAVQELWLRAVHDGRNLRFLLTWPDRTENDRVGTGRQGDGVALQFTNAEDPPMFAMGGSEPVNIWHWRAFRTEDVAGFVDLIGDPLHKWLDMPVPIPGVTEASMRSESIRVRGFADMAKHRGSGLDTPAEPSWQDNTWRLVLGRALKPRSKDEIEFTPGKQVLVAVAVWDAGIDDTPQAKSVSTWHTLAFDQF